MWRGKERGLICTCPDVCRISLHTLRQSLLSCKRASVVKWLRHRSHNTRPLTSSHVGSNPARIDVTVWEALSVYLWKVDGFFPNALYKISVFSLPPTITDRHHITEKLLSMAKNSNQSINQSIFHERINYFIFFKRNIRTINAVHVCYMYEYVLLTVSIFVTFDLFHSIMYVYDKSTTHGIVTNIRTQSRASNLSDQSTNAKYINSGQNTGHWHNLLHRKTATIGKNQRREKSNKLPHNFY
jgi:hypothetical protein